jgi:predicted small secreted protein
MKSPLALTAVYVIALALPAHSSGAGVVTSLNTMRAGLGKDIQYSTKPVPTVRFCPDNTCDVIRGRRGGGAAVQDFALVYLWYASDYFVLDEWRRGAAPQQVGVVVGKNAGSCRGSERAMAKCALLRLAQVGAIRLSFLRYDEGAETEVPMVLSEVLGGLK